MSATDWETIGFNLDGLCTTASSTNVCTLAAGALASVQTDGTNCIDNSYGENFCPMLDELFGTGACSTAVTQVIVVTDASGTGTIAIGVASTWLEAPIADVRLETSGAGGTLGGVLPTAGFVSGVNDLSSTFCSGSAESAVDQEIEQDSDILSDGTNMPGVACSAISMGMKFSASTTFSGSLPVVVNPCGSDAGDL
jgi:hypothetical protein